MNLIAKPIVKGEYWVVTDGDKKVGNVIADGTGFEVKLNGNSKHFKTTNAIKRQTKIDFQAVEKQKPVPPLSSFPTPTKTYNNMLDIKSKLHIFTKTLKSKCYHAAGWFCIKQNDEYVTVFCPKYIFIQRYPYIGPFKTEIEANNSINK